MFRFFVVLFSGLVVCAVSAKATEINKKEVPNWNIFTEEGRDYVWGRAKYNFSETWNSDSYDLYIPFYFKWGTFSSFHRIVCYLVLPS